MNQCFKMKKICRIFLIRERKNFKVWLILLLMLIFSRMYTEECILDYANKVGYGITPWIYVFFTMSPFIRLIYGFLFLMLICDLPYRSKNDLFFLIRSGRVSFCAGNILYLFVNACLFSLAEAICSFVWGIRHLEWSMKWGKVLGTLAMTSDSDLFLRSPTIHSWIIRYETPITMFFYVLFLSVLCCLFLGLTLLLCNLRTTNINIGLFVCVFLILFDFMIQQDPGVNVVRLSYISPVSWSSLNLLDLRDNITMYPSVNYAFIMYVVCDVLLIVWVLKSGRKMKIDEG